MSSFSEKKSKEFSDAARDANLPLVKSLSVDPEVNLNWKDENGCWTPFFCACYEGHVGVVRYLLDFHDNYPREPIDYNLADNSGWTPFFAACLNGDKEMVEMLLEDDRIDVNRANDRAQTPLWWASYYGYLGVVKRLLASTREIDVLKEDNREKKTAAEIARQKGKNKVADLIESYQKDPQGVKKQLRRELGLGVRLAGELFALVVYLSDGFLVFCPERQGQREQRFLSIATKLPMDLQMVLCNRVFGLPDSIVKSTDSERGFRKYAMGF